MAREKFGRKIPETHAGYSINEKIKSKELRLITDTGENFGVVSRDKALGLAQDANLDLVLISKDDTSQAVAKIMDFGKFLYERKKKQHEAKKHQKIVQIKEVKMRPSIGKQDYMVKMKHAIKFLEEAKKVKFTLQFRGRQMIMMNELGNKLFAQISKDLQDANIGRVIEEKETKGRPFWSKIVSIK